MKLTSAEINNLLGYIKGFLDFMSPAQFLIHNELISNEHEESFTIKVFSRPYDKFINTPTERVAIKHDKELVFAFRVDLSRLGDLYLFEDIFMDLQKSLYVSDLRKHYLYRRGIVEHEKTTHRA